VIYAPASAEKEIIETGKRVGQEIFRMGEVKEGPRQVIVHPLDVAFTTKDIKGE
jgi:hypothetical protein